MAHNKKQKQIKNYSHLILVKEIFMALLAVSSVFFVFYDYFGTPDELQNRYIMRFDIVVAIIFLVDFLFSLTAAQNKRKYLRANWYLLLAAIPIIEGWAELLKGLRLLELVRIIRAGSHLEYVYELSRKK